MLYSEPHGISYKIPLTTELMKMKEPSDTRSFLLSTHKSLYFGLSKQNLATTKSIVLKNGSQIESIYFDVLLRDSTNSFFIQEFGYQSETSSTFVEKSDISLEPGESKKVSIVFNPETKGLMTAKLVFRSVSDNSSRIIPLYGFGGFVDIKFENVNILNDALILDDAFVMNDSKLKIRNSGNIPAFVIASSKNYNQIQIAEPFKTIQIETKADQTKLIYGPECMRQLFLKDWSRLPKSTSSSKLKALQKLYYSINFASSAYLDPSVNEFPPNFEYKRSIDDHLCLISYAKTIRCEKDSNKSEIALAINEYSEALSISPKNIIFDSANLPQKTITITNKGAKTCKIILSKKSDLFTIDSTSLEIPPNNFRNIVLTLNCSLDDIKSEQDHPLSLIHSLCEEIINVKFLPGVEKYLRFNDNIQIDLETRQTFGNLRPIGTKK